MTGASVIIPCYNVEEYIFECLDSVKAQGSIVNEIYCVDNNSTDATISVIKKWIKRNPEINTLILKEVKKGACAARNKPLNFIKSEWIQFLDADDLLLKDKISWQINKSNKSDIIYDSSLRRSSHGEETKKIPDSNILLGLMKGNLGNTCANLWNKNAVMKVGGWNENLSSSQEYDLMMRLYNDGASFQKLDTFKTVIREREFGQISQSNEKKRWENYTKIRVDFFRENLHSIENAKILDGFMSHLFRSFQLLYRYNDKLAITFHDETLRGLKFKPESTTIKSGIYLCIYSILGFKNAEYLRSLVLRKHE
ncbi:MAG: glycosyl transferase family 2 [Bacteroidetes bacterium]|nr:MAG: glycosyl transferase family 2 [Bacteroidota bacterium]